MNDIKKLVEAMRDAAGQCNCGLTMTRAADALERLSVENDILRDENYRLWAIGKGYLITTLGELLNECQQDAALMEFLRPQLTRIAQLVHGDRR